MATWGNPLRNYQTPIIFDISDFEVSQWDPVTCFLDRYNHFHGEPELCFKSTMEPCLQAIFHSKMRFEELDLLVDTLPIDPDERGYSTRDMRSEDLELFSSLRFVSLDLNNTLNDAGTQSTGHIMSYARSVEDLVYRQGCVDLNRENWLTPEQQPAVLNDSQFGCADLVLGSINSSLLISLLEKHADTLTDLRIAHTCLRDGVWAEVFALVKKTCRFVTQLEVEDLSQARPESKIHEYRPLLLSVDWTIEADHGRAGVIEALDKLILAPSLETLDMLDRDARAQQ
ncbi:hypothetical protein E4T44_09210 [Aureobasidium sp. EXF-8845]|nr:hypothetical protein E4T44_09210 [Aureobasidium sp. EXF-8845]KAI4848824.1 hypothetical protein E4T45_06171 [Aureobasidium sp. EXF-8846]